MKALFPFVCPPPSVIFVCVIFLSQNKYLICFFNFFLYYKMFMLILMATGYASIDVSLHSSDNSLVEQKKLRVFKNSN